ncbi:hypothetical protein KY330_03850 [Candidatus Woesearchaeota archaeon]|nr:hypothetical protein [Candidatus Woesearchaeota archaeon]
MIPTSGIGTFSCRPISEEPIKGKENLLSIIYEIQVNDDITGYTKVMVSPSTKEIDWLEFKPHEEVERCCMHAREYIERHAHRLTMNQLYDRFELDFKVYHRAEDMDAQRKMFLRQLGITENDLEQGLDLGEYIDRMDKALKYMRYVKKSRKEKPN